MIPRFLLLWGSTRRKSVVCIQLLTQKSTALTTQWTVLLLVFVSTSNSPSYIDLGRFSLLIPIYEKNGTGRTNKALLEFRVFFTKEIAKMQETDFELIRHNFLRKVWYN